MILCSADKSGRMFTISYHGHVEAVHMRQAMATTTELMARLQPGFFC